MAEKVIGKYLVGDELGHGALGKIYAAKHQETGQQVAFSGFVRPPAEDEEHWRAAEERFKRELEQAQRLDHPNIAKVVDFGDDGNLYHVATEYFVGKNLKHLLEEHRRPFQPDELKPIIEQAAQAIDYASTHGICHGDLSPLNIIVTGDGHVKIVNYGIAHCRHKLGSPYLAPEQLTGFPGNSASDIYALGAVAYEMLAGAPPFTGEDAHDVARKIHSAIPSSMPNQPDWVNHVVDRMLCKDPAERYVTAMEAIADFHEQRAPVGHVHQAQRPVVERAPWEPEHYAPPPSIADYRMHDSDVREYRHAKHHAAELAALRMRRLRNGLATVAVAVVMFWCVRDLFSLPERARTSQVSAVTGTPLRYDFKQRAWHALRADEPVLSSETIATDRNATATLQFYDGSRVKLMPNSMLTFDDLDYKPRKRKSVRELKLWQGELWVYARPFRSGSTFAVNSTGAVTRLTGAKETKLNVRSERAGSRIANLQGEASVSPPRSSPVSQWQQAPRVMLVAVIDARPTVVFAAATAPSAPAAGGTPLPENKAMEAIRNALNEVPLPPELKAELEKQGDLLKAASAFDSMRALMTSLEEGVMPPVTAVANMVGMLNPAKTIDDATAMAKAMTAMQAITKSMDMDFMDSNQYPQHVDLKTLDGAGLSQEAIERILRCFEDNQLKSYKLHARDDYEFSAVVKDSKKTVVVARKGLIKPVKEKDD